MRVLVCMFMCTCGVCRVMCGALVKGMWCVSLSLCVYACYADLAQKRIIVN